MLPQCAGTGISNVFSWRKHLFMELLIHPNPTEELNILSLLQIN